MYNAHFMYMREYMCGALWCVVPEEAYTWDLGQASPSIPFSLTASDRSLDLSPLF